MLLPYINTHPKKAHLSINSLSSSSLLFDMDLAQHSQSSPPPQLNLDNLKALKILGKGAMGTVFLVHDDTDNVKAASFPSPFALKVVEKDSFFSKIDAERRARWEIEVLSRLSLSNHKPHPFLPHILGSFESDEFLGWAVPYCPGGDLNVLRYRQVDRVFSPAVIRFYLAEIVCALDHLHSMDIVYRDLKPENVLIQQSGHVTLTDFDLSRNLTRKTIGKDVIDPVPVPVPVPVQNHRRNLTRWITKGKTGLRKAKSARVSPVSRKKTSFVNGERSFSFVGTEEYVSPEVVRGEGHEFAVDWWALGILTYEMLYGTTPFKGKTRKETFRNVLVKPPEFVGKRSDLTDFIERLLEKDPTKRLGYRRGACEIKEHAFFNGVQWDLLTEVSRSPFIPATENLTSVCSVDIREYFHKQRAPPSPLSSPSTSFSCQNNETSLTEF